MRARFVAAAMLALVIVGMVAGPAAAAGTPGVVVKAKINSRDISTIDQNQPLRLHPDKQVVVDLTVTNNTTRDVPVRSVNLNGRVIGLTFFSFETRIDLLIPPGTTETRTFAIELIGLNGQATGLLPGSLELLGDHRQVISRLDFATDVQGSLKSVYGIFGVMVAAITALLMIGAIIRLASHRLSIHRWSRGAHFGAAGLGLGLTLTFSLSALRVLLPKPSSWLTIVLVSAIVLFIVGYLTPTPTIYFAPADEEGVEPERRLPATSSVR